MRRLLTYASRQQTPIALGVLALVAVALYARSLGGYFLADDFANVAISSSYPLSRWPRLFYTDLSEGIWGEPLNLLRPFIALFSTGQGHLFQAYATPYRVVSLTLHIINVWLVFTVVRRSFSGSRFVAFAAALLFAVHPVHAETVTWIAGQSDLLPTALFLGALLAFISFRETGRRRDGTLLVALAAGAVFTKESTVTLPLLVAAYDALRFRHSSWENARRAPLRFLFPYIGLAAVLAVYFACRHFAFGSGAGVPLLAAGLPSLWQMLTAKYSEYLLYLLSRPAFIWMVGGMFVAATAIAIARRQSDSVRMITFFGPVWFFVLSAPFLFTHNYPRHMYSISAGLCVVIATAAAVLFSDRAWVFRWGAIALIASVFAARNVEAVNRWTETGIISKNINRSIRRLASKPPGTVLLLDLPGAINDAHLFHWSSPFLLGRPFYSPPLTERFTILEAPTSYFSEGAWRSHPAIERIANIDANTRVYFVDYDQQRGGRSRKLDPLKVRAAAEALRSRLASPASPALGAEWRQFVDAAR